MVPLQNCITHPTRPATATATMTPPNWRKVAWNVLRLFAPFTAMGDRQSSFYAVSVSYPFARFSGEPEIWRPFGMLRESRQSVNSSFPRNKWENTAVASN